MQKNVASQKWTVFAFDETDNTAKTGDAAQITGTLYIDGVSNVIDDTNPTELAGGYYEFDITQAESNGNYISIVPASSTGNIQVIGSPGSVWTTPANFSDMGIESDGDIAKVNLCDTNTDMVGTDSAALASVCTEGRLAELDAANLPADVDAILVDTGTTIPADIAGLNDFDPANDTVARVTLTDTTTTNTDMRGTDSANTTVPDAAGTAATLHGITDGKVDSVQTDTTAIKAKTDNLPSGVAKNVALANFTFYMTDSVDHITAKTGLTVTSQISKDGGAYGSTSNSVSEIGVGAYKISLTQAEMNAGVVSLSFTSTGADQRVITILTT